MSDLGFEPTARAFLPGIGTLLDGKYRIEKVIGKGGMGIVYAAHHELLGERVALKLLLEEVARKPEAIARFLNEARSAAKIKNDHVARVMDVGTLDKGGVAFIALEYLEGRDLAQLLGERGRLAPSEATDYVLQALEAVAAAHALGIIHRDLKPANLFLAQQAGDDVIKVLDFGISKVLEDLHAQVTPLTSAETLLGTPFYSPPEQLRNARTVDTRADIWAVGVILYELVTGVLPFNGELMGEIFTAILEQTPIPPSVRCPDLPPGLDWVILKCLAKSPDQRYANVGELAADLAQFAPPGHVSPPKIQKTLARGVGRASLAEIVVAPGAPVTSAAWSQSRGETAAARKRSLLVAIAVAAPIAIAIAILAFSLFLRTGTHAVTVPSAPPAASPPPVTIEPLAVPIPSSFSTAPESSPAGSGSAAASAPPVRKSSAIPSAKPAGSHATPAPSENPIFFPQ